ncbi:MAG TPA: hypothetical protein VEX15_15105 [Nocardioidaceae bacterium]|nr:hypothetical protein [Nocardioidaceae bacterium]
MQRRRPAGRRHPTHPELHHLRDLRFGQRADRDNRTRFRQQRRNITVASAANGRDDGEPATGKPANHKVEHTARRRIEPLHVIEDQQLPLPSRHRLKHLEDGKIHSECVCATLGWIGTQQHHVEYAAQPARQTRGKLADVLADEVEQAKERQVRLGSRSTRTANRETNVGRFRRGRPHEGRLANTRRADKHNRPRGIIGYASTCRRKLPRTPDDTWPVHHQSASIAQRSRGHRISHCY